MKKEVFDELKNHGSREKEYIFQLARTFTTKKELPHLPSFEPEIMWMRRQTASPVWIRHVVRFEALHLHSLGDHTVREFLRGVIRERLAEKTTAVLRTKYVPGVKLSASTRGTYRT